MVISSEIYEFFSNYVFKHTGILYKETDYYRLDSRFNALVKKFELDDVKHLHKTYIEKITPEMHQVLIDLCTNNETYFMRDLKPFKALGNEVFEYLNSTFSNSLEHCLFMHCMPAHPGEEVDQSVLDSNRSIIFDQAENRLHMQKSILSFLSTCNSC